MAQASWEFVGWITWCDSAFQTFPLPGVSADDPYQKRLTPMTDRMAGDMRIRHLAPATIDAYTYHVGRFADFIQKPLGDATAEDVRNFQLDLIEEKKVGWSSFNQAVCGLRFLYTTTLPKPWPVSMIPFGKRPRRLPTVLAVEEVDALPRCTRNLKQRTFLITLYSAGLRLSEAADLQIAHIDSGRMQLNVAAGRCTCYPRATPRHVASAVGAIRAGRRIWSSAANSSTRPRPACRPRPVTSVLLTIQRLNRSVLAQAAQNAAAR